MRTSKIPKSKLRRRINWAWRQKAKTKVCPPTPRQENKILAITGGNSGVGLETVKGLLSRGAEVIMLSRNSVKSEKVVQSLSGAIHFVQMDLGDLNSVKNAVPGIQNILNGRNLDTLICNAGVGSMFPYTLSPQGYELTFAINVLGHHALFKLLDTQSILANNAHVIAVTGDLYFQADDCTPNYEYKGKRSMQAYARSKVGVSWWGFQCYRNYPNYKVNLVHPGVIPMGLGGDQNLVTLRKIMTKLLLSPEGGAQTTLNVATQPGIENGAYYHNTMGEAILPEGDIALDKDRAEKFWQQLETICAKKL